MQLIRFLAYAAIGAVGTGVQFLTLVVLTASGFMTAPTASGLGAIFGAVTNYLLNYYLNFRTNRSHASAATRFFVVAALSVLINWAAMLLLVFHLGWNYLLAQCVSSILILAFTFVVNSVWSFQTVARESF